MENTPDDISPQDVVKFLTLAHLDPAREDTGSLRDELSAILHQVKQLFTVNVDGVEPMTHAQSSSDVFREDKVGEHLPAELSLANAPDRSGNYIRVPLVIEG